MEIIKVIIASLFSAAVMFVIAKIIGHKQISQLDFFDYVTGITLGSIAAELATTLETPWWKPLVSMLVFGFVTYMLSYITMKFPKTRKYITGSPTIIINSGKIYRKNMRKAKLVLSELMLMCRQEGYFNLDDIQTAVYEYNGKLSILPVSTKRPLNPEDMKLSPPPENIGTEVIMDGRILGGNLRRRNLSKAWLQNELKAQGYQSAKQIFLGVCGKDDRLTLYPSD